LVFVAGGVVAAVVAGGVRVAPACACCLLRSTRPQADGTLFQLRLIRDDLATPVNEASVKVRLALRHVRTHARTHVGYFAFLLGLCCC
jgi:hypothetical protein